MISLKNIVRKHESSVPIVTSIDDVSLEIKKGEVVVIVGASGSGKSSLLKVIALSDIKYSGKYLLDNKDVKTFSNSEISKYRNEKFAVLFQEFLLIEDETVFENIRVPLIYSSKFSKNKHKEMILNFCEEFEISELVNKKVCNLSQGEKQRVALVRSLVNDCEIILLDEPTSALNKELSKKLIDKIYEYVRKNNKTLIIVTHDLEEVVRGNYRLIKIEDSKIVEDKLMTL